MPQTIIYEYVFNLVHKNTTPFCYLMYTQPITTLKPYNYEELCMLRLQRLSVRASNGGLRARSFKWAWLAAEVLLS